MNECNVDRCLVLKDAINTKANKLEHLFTLFGSIIYQFYVI